MVAPRLASLRTPPVGFAHRGANLCYDESAGQRPFAIAPGSFAMSIAVLRLSFALPAETLKEKRSIVKSVVERVRSRYNAACAAARCGAGTLGREHAGRDHARRPRQVGGPWPVSPPGFFSDAAHQDHINLSFGAAAPAGGAGPPAAAGTIGFAFGGTFFLYNSAFDREMQQLGPGMVLVGEDIRLAIEDGCRAFDLLKGDYAYKYRFGAKAREVRRLLVTR